jgi:hypothetical protein
MIPGFRPHPRIANARIDAIAIVTVPGVAETVFADGAALTAAFNNLEMLVHCRQIYVGGAGDVVYQRLGDTADVTRTFAAGESITGLFKIVKGTGTTATNISLIY